MSIYSNHSKQSSHKLTNLTENIEISDMNLVIQHNFLISQN